MREWAASCQLAHLTSAQRALCPLTVDYSAHAIDQMQGRGIPPSVVQNTIQNGAIYPTGAGTTGYYDSVNNVRVITSASTGRVVTVIPGSPRK